MNYAEILRILREELEADRRAPGQIRRKPQRQEMEDPGPENLFQPPSARGDRADRKMYNSIIRWG